MRSPVLVIEDYADLRLAILATLDRAHYNGVGAATTEDAIRKLKAGNYSAIVLDPVADVRTDPVMMFLRDYQPEQVRKAVMDKLKKHGKGIVLLHDFQHATGEAAMDLLNDLKAGGYKIVFMKPKFAVTTLPAYDEQVLKLVKGPGGGDDTRPTSSVVRTIAE